MNSLTRRTSAAQGSEAAAAAAQQDLENAIAQCREITQRDASAPAPVVKATGGGGGGAGAAKLQQASGASFKTVLAHLTNYITSTELVTAALAALHFMLAGRPDAPAMLRLEGGVRACVMVLIAYRNARPKFVSSVTKLLARPCLNSPITSLAFIKEPGAYDAVMQAVAANISKEEVVGPCCDLLVALSRHEKPARTMGGERLVGALREVLVSHLGHWDTFGAVLRVLKNLAKHEAVRPTLLKSPECLRLLLGVTRILAHLPERYKLFKRAYRTLWLLSQPQLTPLPVPNTSFEAASAEPADAAAVAVAEARQGEEDFERAVLPEDYPLEGDAPAGADAQRALLDDATAAYPVRVSLVRPASGGRAAAAAGASAGGSAAGGSAAGAALAAATAAAAAAAAAATAAAAAGPSISSAARLPPADPPRLPEAELSADRHAVEPYHAEGSPLIPRMMLHMLERIVHPQRSMHQVVYDNGDDRAEWLEQQRAAAAGRSGAGDAGEAAGGSGAGAAGGSGSSSGGTAAASPARRWGAATGQGELAEGWLADSSDWGVGVDALGRGGAAGPRPGAAANGAGGSGHGVVASGGSGAGDPERSPPLQLDSRFESGNLARAVRIADREYDLMLAPDANDTQMRAQWFYLSVTNAVPGASYRFNVVNLGKKESLYNMGLRPLLCRPPAPADDDPPPGASGSGREPSAAAGGACWLWERAGEDVCYYPSPYYHPASPAMGGTGSGGTHRKSTAASKSAGGRFKADDGKAGPVREEKWCKGGMYMVTFTITFHSRGTHYLAMCYPYTYSDLQRYLSSLGPSLGPYYPVLRRSLLCTTLAGHRCDLLTVTDFEAPGEEIAARPYVVLTARVHPGESNASWVMQGAMEFLLSDTDEAAALRRKYVFKLIPMLNPDGVINGSYRCSLAGVDLNRCWAVPDRRRHPEIACTKRLIAKLAKTRGVAFFCDLHGHSRKPQVFMYGCEPTGEMEALETGRERVRLIPYLLSRRSAAFSFSDCTFKTQKSKLGTGRVVVARELRVPYGYTLEASLSGGTHHHFGQRELQTMGVDLVRAFAEALGSEDDVELLACVAAERARLAAEAKAGKADDDDGGGGPDDGDDGPGEMLSAAAAAAAGHLPLRRSVSNLEVHPRHNSSDGGRPPLSASGSTSGGSAGARRF